MADDPTNASGVAAHHTDPDADACAHETLMPRWRGPEVMDDDSKAMGWVCHRCHREFPPYLVQDRKLKRVMI